MNLGTISLGFLFLLFAFDSKQNKKLVSAYCPEDHYEESYNTYYNSTAFLSTWQTISSDLNITITTIGGGYLYDVAWGDGTSSTNVTGNITHTYPGVGTYQISITGSFPRMYFNYSPDRNRILSIDQWGIQPWVSMEKAFWGCSKLKILATDSPVLTNVTNMEQAFRDCNSMNEDLSGWNVSSVTNMKDLFQNCDKFNQDLSAWNVSNVTNMHGLFDGCNDFDQDLSAWNVSNVTDMRDLFRGSSFDQDLSDWNVSNVTNMANMFLGSNFNQDLSNWDMSNVTNIEGMLSGLNYTQDLSSWDVSNVTNMANLFGGTTSNNSSISGWDVSSVTDMRGMFAFSSFNNNSISTWDVSSVTTMEAMFRNSDFNQDVSSWDVSNVTDMEFMFHNCPFNQDLCSWDVSNVTTMEKMFQANTDFDQDISCWDISGGPNMNDMFRLTGISIEKYDNMLISWAEQDPSATVFDAGNSQYCAGAAARADLINNHGWTISDSGESSIFINNTFTNGTGNNLWEDSGNWSLGLVPSPIHAVLIPSGFTVIVQDHTSMVDDGICFSIEVEEGADFEVLTGATFITTSPCNYF